MQPENLREYEIIRNEMFTVKDCITKYIGYVFAGFGAAIYGLVRIGFDPQDSNKLIIFSMIFSITITAVLFWTAVMKDIIQLPKTLLGTLLLNVFQEKFIYMCRIIITRLISWKTNG